MLLFLTLNHLCVLFSVSSTPLHLSPFSKSSCPAGQRYPCCMASGQGGRLDAGASGSCGLAKPLYLQRLERSLRLDSFLRHTASIFNRDITRYRQRGLGMDTHLLLLDTDLFLVTLWISFSKHSSWKTALVWMWTSQNVITLYPTWMQYLFNHTHHQKEE